MTKHSESFDLGAKQYDEGRLSYPDEVIDWVIEKTRVSKAETLLEIGAGTGQATMPFAKRGFSVHCVEPGKNLAVLLLEKTGAYNVSADISTFEAWAPPEAFRSPLIFCATAFHWLDINIKYQKCHSLLSEGGHLVLLWNGDVPNNNPIINEAYRRLFSFHPEKAKKTNASANINDARRQEILSNGLFELADFLCYPWFPVQKREVFIKGFFSQSSFLSLNQEQQKVLSYELNELFAGLDDEIKTETYTSVFIARKVE